MGRLPNEGSNRGEDQRSERTSLRRNKKVKAKLLKEGEWMERKFLRRGRRKLKRKFRKKILKREWMNEKKDFKIRKNELEDRF